MFKKPHLPSPHNRLSSVPLRCLPGPGHGTAGPGRWPGLNKVSFAGNSCPFQEVPEGLGGLWRGAGLAGQSPAQRAAEEQEAGPEARQAPARLQFQHTPLLTHQPILTESLLGAQLCPSPRPGGHEGDRWQAATPGPGPPWALGLGWCGLGWGWKPRAASETMGTGGAPKGHLASWPQGGFGGPWAYSGFPDTPSPPLHLPPSAAVSMADCAAWKLPMVPIDWPQLSFSRALNPKAPEPESQPLPPPQDPFLLKTHS